MFRRAVVSSAALLLPIVLASAQATHEKVAFTPPTIARPLPFKIGETLIYDVSFSRLIFSGTIGELKLTVSKPADAAKSELIELRADAVSKGFFPSLFGVKLKDRYTSLVDETDFALNTTIKLLEEGKARREQRSVVDRDAEKVTYTDRDLVNPKSVPKVKEKPSPSWIQDLLSTIYFVRTQPLRDGDLIAIPLSDGGEVYNIDVLAVKREEVKTTAGKFKAIQLNARVFNGRYIKRSGEMLVWVTDDASRIPLRARVKTSGSTVTVDLKRMPVETKSRRCASSKDE